MWCTVSTTLSSARGTLSTQTAEPVGGLLEKIESRCRWVEVDFSRLTKITMSTLIILKCLVVTARELPPIAPIALQ